MDIAIQIVNLSNNGYECSATAAENDHQLCLYKKLPDGSFECVAKADYETLELEPNEAFDDKPNVVPNIPGEYYVSDFADINKIVPESNDDNNSTKEDQNVKFRSSQMASNRIIKVLPTLKYFEQLSKGVKIDYFEFKKKSNLKKVWVKSIN